MWSDSQVHDCARASLIPQLGVERVRLIYCSGTFHFFIGFIKGSLQGCIKLKSGQKEGMKVVQQ